MPEARIIRTCASCFFFWRLHHGVAQGRCKRYPPSVRTEEEVLPQFPLVTEDQTCGEHQDRRERELRR